VGVVEPIQSLEHVSFVVRHQQVPRATVHSPAQSRREANRVGALEEQDSFTMYVEDLTVVKNMMLIEALLMNVLPEKIVRKLKQSPAHLAESHDRATVLYRITAKYDLNKINVSFPPG
jgi:hypothetical protein